MSKYYKNYLQFLAAEYNLLYIGKNANGLYDEISSMFQSSSKVAINQNILEKIGVTITKRHINIVIIDVEHNDPMVSDFFHAIKKHDIDMIMLLFNPKEYRKLFEVVPLFDITVSYPLDKEIFYKKLFTLLSRPYALNSIGRRDIILKQENVVEDSSDKFFDTYEGSALFIADDLMQMVERLNAGDLSHEFFHEIAQKLNEIADIFQKSSQMSSVVPIYKHLASYLEELNLETIAPQNLHGFNYLANILKDVSVYLMDMFVDRIFKDVYVFEHSLQNNIDFMQNILEGKEDMGELEFFE